MGSSETFRTFLVNLHFGTVKQGMHFPASPVMSEKIHTHNLHVTTHKIASMYRMQRWFLPITVYLMYGIITRWPLSRDRGPPKPCCLNDLGLPPLACAGGFVKFMDLSLPQHLEQRFDWVMSLEVAEHIPHQFEHILLGNIARHAKEGVVLTWAVPGQGGHFHVNTQTNAYAIEQMRQLGFKHDAQQSQTFKDAAVLKWFKDTIMVFNRVDKL